MNGIKHINMDYEKKHNKDIAMTAEKKAKAYDEALERARKTLRAAGGVGTDIVTFIFPQFAENEDERIREEIIGYLKHRAEVTGFIDEDKDCKRWIAYLEKQKEKKPAGCADDVVEEAEEYASKVACGEYGVEVTEAYIAGVLSERNRGTWWSEKDERMRNQLICDVEHHKKEGLISAKQNKATKALYSEIEKCYDEKIAWLKSLPDRFNLQPKQEWSEEDKRNIDRAVFYVRYYQRTNGNTDGSKECIDWLKSLRPIWKPSEEQMHYLKKVYDSYDFCDGERSALESLYEQLEKLM